MIPSPTANARFRTMPSSVLPASQAGFGDAREVAHAGHRFGRVTFVQATRLLEHT
ncbi:hypothetical protein OG417_39790 [Actinoallomurus sp. NBC_01490]|uniref:hypothetical protein n=1 Tax=Actinoallomurus sp. NBC_01490 TaxID=2903557 RepID=UPI002E379146|nr:hypothetical protein [Actinoallomurus sp. NBC_01490]